MFIGTLSASSFDVICIVDHVQVTDLDLPTILHLLRPDGIVWILQLNVRTDADSKPATDSVISALTLGGFVKPRAEVCCLALKFLEGADFLKSVKQLFYWFIAHVN